MLRNVKKLKNVENCWNMSKTVENCWKSPKLSKNVKCLKMLKNASCKKLHAKFQKNIICIFENKVIWMEGQKEVWYRFLVILHNAKDQISCSVFFWNNAVSVLPTEKRILYEGHYKQSHSVIDLLFSLALVDIVSACPNYGVNLKYLPLLSMKEESFFLSHWGVLKWGENCSRLVI